MDYTLLIFLLASFSFNVVFWSIQYAVQQWELRTSRIPQRSKEFLHLQDLLIITWGDNVGLSLIDGSLVFVVLKFGIPPCSWIAFAGATATLITFLFYRLCKSPAHMPDSGCLEFGRISVWGKIHIPYFALQTWLILAGTWYFVFSWTPILFITIAGGIFYGLMYFLDIKKGKYWKRS